MHDNVDTHLLLLNKQKKLQDITLGHTAILIILRMEITRARTDNITSAVVDRATTLVYYYIFCNEILYRHVNFPTSPERRGWAEVGGNVEKK